MKIKYVTITGADDNTRLEDLIEIHRQFPFVEWGILFSKSRQGQSRYPSAQRIKELKEVFQEHKMRFSLHLCGDIAKNLANGDEENANDIIDSMAFPGARFRVQLNFNAMRDPFNFDVLEWLDRKIKKLQRQQKVKLSSLIFQWNAANEATCRRAAFIYSDPPYQIDFLMDASGGNGTPITNFFRPDTSIKHFLGYAGGIGPDNIQEVVKSVEAVPAPDGPKCHFKIPKINETWIDMESGVRTNDQLDIEKVKKVLLQVQEHQKSHADTLL